MNCIACEQPLPKNHSTHTTILFYTCPCGHVQALEKGKIRNLKPNEKAFLVAISLPC